MRFHLLIKPRAEKELTKLPGKDRQRVLGVIAQLHTNPYIGKKLEGDFRGYYSLRAWPYRIIYGVMREKLIIVVIRIGHRQGVYR